jgi:hypothetical protein
MVVRLVRGIIPLILLAFPIVILWDLLPYLDPLRIVPETPAATPQWTQIGDPNTVCFTAMNATPVSETLATIAPSRAAALAAGTIQTQTNLLNQCHSNAYEATRGLGDTPFTIDHSSVGSLGPQLVRQPFQDGQTHLAWVYGQGCVTDERGIEGQVAFVYVDATTGTPLLLTGATVADPFMTCSDLPPHLVDRVTQGRMLFLTGTGITLAYLIIISIVALVLYRRKRVQAT